MSILAVLLIGIGVADLVRTSRLRRWPWPAVAGGTTLLLSAGLAGLLATTGGVLLTLLAALVLCGWTGRPRGSHLLPLAVLVGGCALLVGLSGWAPPAGGALGRWLDWADLPWEASAERALIVVGAAVAQLATGNVVVRHVLTATGAMRPSTPGSSSPEEELKGGRLLGPLERLFILGLGLAGQYTAAGLVIAAKGLIRWPELKALAHESSETAHAGGPAGIDKVTEYFLVGSFVSWLIALVGLALTA